LALSPWPFIACFGCCCGAPPFSCFPGCFSFLARGWFMATIVGRALGARVLATIVICCHPVGWRWSQAPIGCLRRTCRVSFICGGGRALLPDASLIAGVHLAYASSSSFYLGSVIGGDGRRVAGVAPGTGGEAHAEGGGEGEDFGGSPCQG
jgi:hypothetical protein